jgi:DNA-binding transcriptional MocR family regulator
MSWSHSRTNLRKHPNGRIMFELAKDDILEGKADSIRRAIEQAIFNDRLKPGDTLPTVRNLAVDLGINKNTVAVAYRQLQESGLIIADGRRGSIVAGQASRHAGNASGASQTLSVRAGNPDSAFLPGEAELRAALGRMDVSHHLYGEQRNYAPFVQWASDCFAVDNVPVDHGVFVSAGALDLIERAFNAAGLTPGCKIAVEDPGYMSSLALVRSMGFEPVPLALDQSGVVPVSLAAALKAGVSAVVVSSRGQNPTGVATSKTRATELKRIVTGAADVLFIDDDHSSLLGLVPYYPWHSGAAGRWLTVRSLSKFLGPDYRIAVATGDADTLGRLEMRQSVGMGWVSTFLQRLAYELLTTSSVQKKIVAAGVAYRERYEVLFAALKKKGFNVTGSAGLNLWIPIANERVVAERLFDAGWLVRPGRDFCVTERAGIRVTCAHMTTQQCLAFAQALVAVRSATATTLVA